MIDKIIIWTAIVLFTIYFTIEVKACTELSDESISITVEFKK